jgi:hypothetical protein
MFENAQEVGKLTEYFQTMLFSVTRIVLEIEDEKGRQGR